MRGPGEGGDQGKGKPDGPDVPLCKRRARRAVARSNICSPAYLRLLLGVCDHYALTMRAATPEHPGGLTKAQAVATRAHTALHVNGEELVGIHPYSSCTSAWLPIQFSRFELHRAHPRAHPRLRALIPAVRLSDVATLERQERIYQTARHRTEHIKPSSTADAAIDGETEPPRFDKCGTAALRRRGDGGDMTDHQTWPGGRDEGAAELVVGSAAGEDRYHHEQAHNETQVAAPSICTMSRDGQAHRGDHHSITSRSGRFCLSLGIAGRNPNGSVETRTARRVGGYPAVTREQRLYQEYLTRLRSKDREPLHAPDGTVGPFEHGFTRGTNPADLNFKVWPRARVPQ